MQIIIYFFHLSIKKREKMLNLLLRHVLLRHTTLGKYSKYTIIKLSPYRKVWSLKDRKCTSICSIIGCCLLGSECFRIYQQMAIQSDWKQFIQIQQKAAVPLLPPFQISRNSCTKGSFPNEFPLANCVTFLYWSDQ